MTKRVGVRELAIDGPSPPLSGRFRPPSDKSISQRALLFSALAAGESTIENLLDCDDTQALIRALESAGVRSRVEGSRSSILGPFCRVAGSEPPILDVGESGTAARLLLGALAGAGFEAVVVGRGSLTSRPMSRVVEPLRRLGAVIEPAFENRDPDRLPLVVRASPRLRACRIELAIASAQVKSAILLAALGAPGETTIIEPAPSRDHTERLLHEFAIPVTTRSDGVRREIRVTGPSKPRPARVRIPGDSSAMLYPGVLSLLVPGSAIVATDVCLNPTRTAALDVLRRMGARIERIETGTEAGEPVGEVAFHASRLQATVIEPEEVPSLVDDIPVLAVAAAFAARGVTRFVGVGELRVKESDRLETTVALLRAMGNSATSEGDTLIVPAGIARPNRPVEIDASGDHRIAAAGVVAAAAAAGRSSVRGFDCVGKSYPTLREDLEALGAGRFRAGSAP